MAYQVTASDPLWSFDAGELEKQVAAFALAQGKTTQTQWTAFIASISTTAQAIAVCKGLLSSIKCGTP
jgi:hypothetical protein